MTTATSKLVTILDTQQKQRPCDTINDFLSNIPQNDPRYIKNLPPLDEANYIPDDIMLALAQTQEPKENLAPGKQRSLSTTTGASKKPPANVWSHKRREKFKHLTETTPCSCGAGRDISFLYDVPVPKKPAVHLDKNDQSNVRAGTPEKIQTLQLPRSLIPGEYHMVKNKGVLGLEYFDEDYSMYSQDHEDHLTLFPSMKPSSRYEVMKLKQSMKDMMNKVGVNDDAVEVKGPTQMHNLLELIKKEQNLYNVIFHEVIRQCSVDCIERGQLLNDIRAKYNSLLSRVPLQIKGLHDEVLAQRALDRRLTEELLRFKSTISLLTEELALVKAHDSRVTLEAEQAQRELKLALQEAAKNASLLQEYHDLYELQRARLEKMVDVLTQEREMWCAAAYSLAIKVTEESRLCSARKLHIVEKSWMKLANHFTILLSDRDTEVIGQIQAGVDKFRNQIADFNLALLHREDRMRVQVDKVKKGIESWIADYKKTCLSREGQTIATPSIDRQKEMLNEIRDWQECFSICCRLENETLQSLADKFVGDQTCTSEEELTGLRSLLDSWTDNAIKLFSRHRKEDAEMDPNQALMNKLNELVAELCSQYLIRLTGENGVAKGVILMMNMLETWETKLNLSVSANNPIPDNHWGALQLMLGEWYADTKEIEGAIGLAVKDTNLHTQAEKIDSHEIVRRVQKWATTAMTSIDSENAKLVEQVSSLHNEMVHWMIQMLLRLAPNLEGNSSEINEAALLASDTVMNLKTKAYKLFERLTIFSKYVFLCCEGIVRENVQDRHTRLDDSPDLEMNDLKRLRAECAEWIHTAKLLLCRLTGESVPEEMTSMLSDEALPTQQSVPGSHMTIQSSQVSTVSRGISDMVLALSPELETIPGTPPLTDTDTGVSKGSKLTLEIIDEKFIIPDDRMEFIGIDMNTHKKTMSLEQLQPKHAENVLAAFIEDQTRPLTPNTKKAFEALTAMTNLQDKLVDTGQRAFEAEERALVAEATIVTLEEELRVLKASKSEGEFVDAPSISKLRVAKSQISDVDESFLITQQEAKVPTTPAQKSPRSEKKSPRGKKKK